MNDVIIELQDVKKIYKMDGVETPALRGVNMKINKGEFVAIMNPSNSGNLQHINSYILYLSI